MAEYAGETVGCGALIRRDAASCEIAKLAVDEGRQGLGAGRALMEKLIARARALGAREVILETNTRLTAAVTLYRHLGFVDVPLDGADSHYSRVDLIMRLDLSRE